MSGKPRPSETAEAVLPRSLGGGEMNVKVCDVCYYEEHKLTVAKTYWRIKTSVDEYTTDSLRFDLCEEHRHCFKDCKTIEAAIEKAKQLGIKVEVGR